MSSKDPVFRCGPFNAKILFPKELPHQTARVYDSDVHKCGAWLPFALAETRHPACLKTERRFLAVILKEETARAELCFLDFNTEI